MRTNVRSNSCGGVLAAVVSLFCQLQLTLKRLGVGHTGTRMLNPIPENICLDNHPEIWNCLAGVSTRFMLESVGTLFIKYISYISLLKQSVLQILNPVYNDKAFPCPALNRPFERVSPSQLKSCCWWL